MNCPKCKSENNDSAKFCKGCGFDLRTVAVAPNPIVQENLACGKCGTMNSSRAKFCKSCGAPVAATSPAATVLPPAPEISPTTALPSAPASPPAPLLSQVPVPASSSAPNAVPAPASPAMPVSASKFVPTSKTESRSQRKQSPSYLFLASIAVACVGLAGGTYWFMTTGSRESSSGTAPAVTNAAADNPASVASAPIPLAPNAPAPSPAAAAAETAPPSGQVPTSAASTTEPNSPQVTAVAADPGPRADSLKPTLTPVPVLKVLQEKAPEPHLLIDGKSETEVRRSTAQDKRKTDEAAKQQRVQRQAVAEQLERDKARLRNANRTLDDLLK